VVYEYIIVVLISMNLFSLFIYMLLHHYIIIYSSDCQPLECYKKEPVRIILDKLIFVVNVKPLTVMCMFWRFSVLKLEIM
jgi:hypothetical protein